MFEGHKFVVTTVCSIFSSSKIFLYQDTFHTKDIREPQKSFQSCHPRNIRQQKLPRAMLSLLGVVVMAIKLLTFCDNVISHFNVTGCALLKSQHQA